MTLAVWMYYCLLLWRRDSELWLNTKIWDPGSCAAFSPRSAWSEWHSLKCCVTVQSDVSALPQLVPRRVYTPQATVWAHSSLWRSARGSIRTNQRRGVTFFLSDYKWRRTTIFPKYSRKNPEVIPCSTLDWFNSVPVNLKHAQSDTGWPF